LFFSLAPKEQFDKSPEKELSPEVIEKIIEELRRSDEPFAQQLIKELQQKLDNTD